MTSPLKSRRIPCLPDALEHYHYERLSTVQVGRSPRFARLVCRLGTGKKAGLARGFMDRSG